MGGSKIMGKRVPLPAVCSRAITSSSVKEQKATKLKGRTPSSSRWLQRRHKDPLIAQSKFDNYRARSAYKLIEINKKYNLLKKGSTVIDLGARPGSWSQVASSCVGTDKCSLAELVTWNHGMVLAVDKEKIVELPGVYVLDEADITSEITQSQIRDFLSNRRVDLVMRLANFTPNGFTSISDMAPNASGIKTLDHQRIMELNYAAFTLSKKFLKQKGNFVCKLWSGYLLKDFKSELKSCFDTVDEVRLQSTLKDSSEVYFVALGYSNAQD